LFGHEKGAFTGAIEQKKARFERAHKGTIFLDEIGELPPQAQVRLLNVIQNKEIERVGGTKSIPVDIRIVSATHRNLDEMVHSGDFREDLWYRLNVFPIVIPPLRQRKGDIPALVQHFIEKKTIDLKKIDIPRLGPGAVEKLMAYDWPGNIRELQNIVERALILHTQGPLQFTNLLRESNEAPETAAAEQASAPLLPLEEMTRAHIKRAISMANGKISGPGGTADILQVKPSSLRRKMDKLGIPYRKKDVS
jgi:transcriptional regulator with GAF, ATPase, and Fis domain